MWMYIAIAWFLIGWFLSCWSCVKEIGSLKVSGVISAFLVGWLQGWVYAAVMLAEFIFIKHRFLQRFLEYRIIKGDE